MKWRINMTELKIVNTALSGYMRYCFEKDVNPEIHIHEGELSFSLKNTSYAEMKEQESIIIKEIFGKQKITTLPIKEDNKVSGYKIFLSELGMEKEKIETLVVDYFIRNNVSNFIINNKDENNIMRDYTKNKLWQTLINIIQKHDTLEDMGLYSINVQKRYAGIEIQVSNSNLEHSEYHIYGDINENDLNDFLNNFSSNSFSSNSKFMLNDYKIPLLEEIEEEENFNRYSLKILSPKDIHGDIVIRPNTTDTCCITHNGIMIKELESNPDINGITIHVLSNSDNTFYSLDALRNIYGFYTTAAKQLKESFLIMDSAPESSPLSEINGCLFESHIARKEIKVVKDDRNRSLPNSITYKTNNSKLMNGAYLITLKSVVNCVNEISDRIVEKEPIIGILTDSDDVAIKSFFDKQTDQLTVLINPAKISINNMASCILDMAESNLMISKESREEFEENIGNIYKHVLEEMNEEISGENLTLSSTLNQINTDKKDKKIDFKINLD